MKSIKFKNILRKLNKITFNPFGGGVLFLICLCLTSGGFASWIIGGGRPFQSITGQINVGSTTEIVTDLTDFIPYVDTLENTYIQYYIEDNNIHYLESSFGIVIYTNITDGSYFENIDYVNNLNINFSVNIVRNPTGSYSIPSISNCTIYPLNNYLMAFNLSKNGTNFTMPLKSTKELSLYELSTFDNSIGNLAYDINNNLIADQINSDSLISKECCIPIAIVFDLDTSNSELYDFDTSAYDYFLRVNISLSYSV